MADGNGKRNWITPVTIFIGFLAVAAAIYFGLQNANKAVIAELLLILE